MGRIPHKYPTPMRSRGWGLLFNYRGSPFNDFCLPDPARDGLC